MNTILQKRIEEAAEEIGKNFYFVGINPREAAYKAAIQMGNKILQNQWISVEEALPEENGRYLVYAPTYEKGSSSGLDFKDGIGFSRFCNRKWSIEIGYHKRPNCVTHWMPTPSLEGSKDE